MFIVMEILPEFKTFS